jgi:hypothetical protein
MKKIFLKILLVCIILPVFTGCKITDDRTPEGVFRILKKAVEEKDEETYLKYYYFTTETSLKNFKNFGFSDAAIEKTKESKIKKITIPSPKKIQLNTAFGREPNPVLIKHIEDGEFTTMEVEFKYKGEKYYETYLFYKVDGQWKRGPNP